MIKKVESTVRWTYVIEGVDGEEIVRTFYENELQRSNQTKVRVEKVIRRKGGKLYVKWKGYDNYLTVGLIKDIVLYKMSCFLEPYTHSKNKVAVKLDLAYYARKSNLKTQQMLIYQILLKKLKISYWWIRYW